MDQSYKLTDYGKKIAKSILQSRRDEVLDTLYKSSGKMCTDEELSVALGKSKTQVHLTMRKYKDKGMITISGDETSI
jgi:transcription initiation factor IIE alpha subunit